MKKRISKFLSFLLTSSLLVFSMPSVVHGDFEVDGMTFRNGKGGVVLVECSDTAVEKFTIPEKVLLNNTITRTVVGVDDLAFGYCEDLTTVYVPSTLKTSEMGNTAFLTATSIVDFMNDELGPNASFEDVVRYIAKEINYNNGNYTEDDIDEISLKVMEKLDMVDTSGDATLEAKTMTLIKNIDQMGLSQTTLMKFDLWIAGVTYSNMTIKGEADTEIQQYTNGRSFLGLKYEVTSVHPLEEEGCELYYAPIDTNGDGVNDGISITGYTGNVQELTIPSKIDSLPVVDIAADAFKEALMLNTLTVPKTVESVGEQAIGFFPDGTKIENFTIRGYSDTQVYRYALRNGITFIDVNSLPALSMTEVELDVDDMIGISVENYGGEIEWVSSDTTVATIADGYIKGISGGEATIYAFAGDTVLECHVTVKGSPVYSTVTVTTATSKSIEPPISLTSKVTVTSATQTLEPPISLTSKTTTTTSISIEPPISLTSKTTVSTTKTSSATKTTKTTSSSSSASSASVSDLTTKTSASSTKLTSHTTVSGTTSVNSDTSSSSSKKSSTSVTSTSTTSTLISSTSNSISSTSISTLDTTSLSTSETSTNTTSLTSVTPGSSTTASTSTNTTSSVSGSTSASSSTSLSTVTTVTTVTTSVTTLETKIAYIGDANEDGKVNVSDAAYIAKMLAIRQAYALPQDLADYNRDGKVTVSDAAGIARALASRDKKDWLEVIIFIYPI